MKSVLTGLGIVSVIVMAGCTQGTPGGPGATSHSTDKPTIGQADDTFNLSVPMMASSLQQGEKAEVSVGIKRAKDFDEDVSLQFSDLPKGVTIEPARPVIKHGDKDAKIAFKAGDKAAVGEFNVKVTGHPTKGGDAEVAFKLEIVAATEPFVLTTPVSTTSLKQGEARTVVIGIKRQKRFDQDVALAFGDLPTGVTIEPAAPIIKNGETETQVTFSGAEDAALGDFDIKLTGHPLKGDDTSNEIKLTVVSR